MAGGLCSGARSESSSSFAITASSICTDSTKVDPPCTVRWPTATTESRSGPCSTNIFTTAATASVWSAKRMSSWYSEPPTSWSMVDMSCPMRCTIPTACGPGWDGSSNWYLIDDDPQLRSRIGCDMGISLFIELRWPPGRLLRCCGGACQTDWAWMAVIVIVETMSSTRAPRDRSLTGFFSPCRTGPIATAPEVRWTAL